MPDRSPKDFGEKIVVVDEALMVPGSLVLNQLADQNVSVTGLLKKPWGKNFTASFFSHKNISFVVEDDASRDELVFRKADVVISAPLFTNFFSEDPTEDDLKGATLSRLEFLVRKIEEEVSRFILIFPQSVLVAEELQKDKEDIVSFYKKVAGVFDEVKDKGKLTEVFLPQVLSLQSVSSTKIYPWILFRSIEDGEVTVVGEGSEEFSFISEQDASFALLKIFNDSSLKGVSVSGEKLKAVSAAYELQNVYRGVKGLDLKVDFLPGKVVEVKNEIGEGSELFFKPKENWKAICERLIANPGGRENSTNEIGYVEKRSLGRPPAHKIGGGAKRIIFPIVIFLVFAPAIIVGLFNLFALKNLESLESGVASGKVKTLRVAESSTKSFKIASFISRYYYPLFFLLGQKDKIDAFLLLEKSGASASESVENFSEAEKPLKEILTNFGKVESKNIDQNVGKVQAALDAAILNLNVSWSGLKQSQDTLRWPFLSNRIEAAASKEKNVVAVLEKVKAVIQIYPQLAGITGEKKYLVLLANNAEIRGTGGFIGSYAVLSFQGGGLANFKVDDIYNLDGQLRIKIVPPSPLKEKLGVDRQYLRDSSWSPNFLENAALAEKLYSDATGNKVDGVFLVDLSEVEDLLSIIGPVNIPNFSDKVTTGDLFEKGTRYSEVNFFPGSTQKKDFLSSVAGQIIETVSTTKSDKVIPLAYALAKGAAQKHVLLYFNDTWGAQLARLYNWDGYAPSFSGSTEDYLMIVDSNIGANKVNRFIKRDIDLQVVVDRDGFIGDKLTITLTNENKSNSWPAGTYTDFLRLFIPQKSTVASMDFAGDKDIHALGLDQVGETLAISKTVSVPAGESRKFVMEYRLDKPLEAKSASPTYRLYIQKQPGTLSDSLTLSIDQPGYLKYKAGDFSMENGKLIVRTRLDSDSMFKAVFEKK